MSVRKTRDDTESSSINSLLGFARLDESLGSVSAGLLSLLFSFWHFNNQLRDLDKEVEKEKEDKYMAMWDTAFKEAMENPKASIPVI